MSGLKKLFSALTRERGALPSGDVEAVARYQEQIVKDLGGAVGAPAATTPGGSPVPIAGSFERLYVEHRLSFASDPDSGNPGGRELTGKRPVWDFLKSPKLAQNVPIAVLGGPGSGRSALLTQLALTFARGGQDRHDLRPMVPVLLSAKDHVVPWDKDHKPLPQALHEHLSAQYKDLSLPKGFFERVLERSDSIFLIDGLDEVSEAARRGAMSYLERALNPAGRARVIYSARPQGYREAPARGGWMLELQPFSAEQVRRAVEQALADESQAGGAAGRAEASRRAAELFARLRSHPSLASMTQVPLLLQTLVRMAKDPAGLPARRADLYGKLCEALVIQGTRGGKDGFTPTQRLAVFRVIAASMSKRKVRQLKQPDIIKLVAPLFPSSTPQAVENFAKTLSTGTGLWMEVEAGSWRFAHQALQDYLTATYFVEKKGPGGPWDELIGDPHWDETIILYCSMGDATPVLQGCLQSQTVSTLTLASQCLQEAVTVAPDVKAQADKILVESLEAEGKRRVKGAEVMLNRRFKGMQKMEDGRDIDLTFISTAEYQLFLDDMRQQGQYFQPDHWDTTTFEKGTAMDPIAGVRAEDARDFCWWLTFKQSSQGSTFKYRLPRPDEARQYPALSADLACWCSDGDQFSLMGLAPKHEQTLREQMEALPLLTLRPSLVLERALRTELGPDLDEELVRALRIDIESALEKAVVKGMSTVRQLVMGRASDLGAVITPDLDLARMLARARQAMPVAAALDKIRLQEAKRLLLTMQKESEGEIGFKRFTSVMLDILDAVGRQSVQDVQQAQRKYLAKMAEYLYYDIPAADAQRKQAVLEFYGWLQLMIARAAGQLLSWEGIRVVREPVGPEGLKPPPGMGFNWATVA